MLNRRTLLTGTAAAAGLAACATTSPTGGADANAQADTLLSGMAEALLAEYPENASNLGVDTGARAALKSRLTDRSEAGNLRRKASAEARLAQLRALPITRLSGQTRVNVEATLFAHETAVEGYRFPYGDVLNLNLNWAYANTPYVVNPGTGFFAAIPSMLDTDHTVQTTADADAYLARLEAFADGLSDEAVRVAEDGASGVIPPDFMLDTAITQLADYRRQPIETWGLVTSLDRRAPDLETGPSYRERALRLCRERVAPALERQIAALQGVRTRATSAPGVARLPGGDAYYAWALKASTTTTRTPDEVHRQGLAENAALKAEMETLLRARGLTQGTVGERMTALGRQPENLFANTDAGRAELLAYLNAITADMRTRLPRAFENLPAAPLEIRRVPPASEAGAPNGYASAGPVDGSRPGIYYINLRDTGNWPKFSLPTLTFHEGVPGHIWQGSYQNRLPLILNLLSFNAYTEGWALYAEQLADELGVYADDPLGRLGYLQSLQFRACRLVVDTGLHAKGWGREQAIRFLVEETGRPVNAMTSEINRYCFWPGQACGYKVGHTEVVRLREGARRALGPRFDVRAFNDAIIRNGSVPLAVLEQIVARWTAERRA